MRERHEDDVIQTMTNFFQITILPTERLIFTIYDNSANILIIIMNFLEILVELRKKLKMMILKCKFILHNLTSFDQFVIG